jgi:ferritin-like metal-binding protein YciE
MADLSSGDAKLVQYLNEAYGTEMRLETALQEHITMALRPSYRKRLKEHLSETKRHAREVKQAITRLGGTAETISTPGPQPVTDVAEAVIGGAHKAVALAQGPLHMLRGTGPEEKQLKNAKTEYASEAEEIATYTAVTTLADTLGNKEVRQLASAILREEERMSAFLAKEIARLTSAVAKAEVPAAERRSGSSSKRSSRAGARSATAKHSARSARASVSRATASSRKAAGKRASAASSRAKSVAGKRVTAASSRAKSAAGSARKSAAGTRKAATSTARKASSGAKKAATGSRASTRKHASSARKPALAGSR